MRIADLEIKCTQNSCNIHLGYTIKNLALAAERDWWHKDVLSHPAIFHQLGTYI